MLESLFQLIISNGFFIARWIEFEIKQKLIDIQEKYTLAEIEIRKLYDFLRLLRIYDEELINAFREIESYFGLKS